MDTVAAEDTSVRPREDGRSVAARASACALLATCGFALVMSARADESDYRVDCPRDTIIAPGRHVDGLYGVVNSSSDTLVRCICIGDERGWPLPPLLCERTSLLPGGVFQLVLRIQVPDTAAAGRNPIRWVTGCGPVGGTCLHDIVVPELLGPGRVEALPTRVLLSWPVRDSTADTAAVWRRVSGGEWQAIGSSFEDPAGDLVFLDTAIEPGATYDYRLGLPVADRQIYRGETRVVLPDLVESASLRMGYGVADLSWAITVPLDDVVVERRVGGDSWRAIAKVSSEGDSILYRDGDLESGVLYEYRLRIAVDGREYVRGAAGSVSPIPPSLLEMRVAGANPSRAPARLTLVAGDEPGGLELEIFDLFGRRLLRRELGQFEARRVIDLPEIAHPGVYLARVARGNTTRSVRFVVL